MLITHRTVPTYQVGEQVKKTAGRRARNKLARKLLSEIVFPESFQLPVKPQFTARGLVVKDCRVMSSKKLPLLLTFESADSGDGSPRSRASTFKVLFKIGDDVRQDQLTLQVMRVMAKLWKRNGLNLQMSPYECVAPPTT